MTSTPPQQLENEDDFQSISSSFSLPSTVEQNSNSSDTNLPESRFFEELNTAESTENNNQQIKLQNHQHNHQQIDQKIHIKTEHRAETAMTSEVNLDIESRSSSSTYGLSTIANDGDASNQKFVKSNDFRKPEPMIQELSSVVNALRIEDSDVSETNAGGESTNSSGDSESLPAENKQNLPNNNNIAKNMLQSALNRLQNQLQEPNKINSNVHNMQTHQNQQNQHKQQNQQNHQNQQNLQNSNYQPSTHSASQNHVPNSPITLNQVSSQNIHNSPRNSIISLSGNQISAHMPNHIPNHSPQHISLLKNTSIELSELMKEQNRRELCEHQITKLQQKMLSLQQKIRVHQASEQHKQRAINQLDEAVGKMIKEHRERESKNSMKLQELGNKNKILTSERADFSEQYVKLQDQLQELQESLGRERRLKQEQDKKHVEKLTVIQSERDDLWARNEHGQRNNRLIQSDNSRLKQEIELAADRCKHLQQELNDERNEGKHNLKMLLQEKEEQVIGLQLDLDRFKEDTGRLKFERDRVEGELINMRNEAKEAQNIQKRLSDKIGALEAGEREFRRVIQGNEKKFESLLNQERAEYSRG